MHESDERFLERLRVELEPFVGPRARLTSMTIEGDTSTVRLDRAIQTPSGIVEIRSDAESVLAAAIGLRERVAAARLAAAFREVLDDGR